MCGYLWRHCAFDAYRVDRHKEERLAANRLAAGTDNWRRLPRQTGAASTWTLDRGSDPWDNTSPRD